MNCSILEIGIYTVPSALAALIDSLIPRRIRIRSQLEQGLGGSAALLALIMALLDHSKYGLDKVQLF